MEFDNEPENIDDYYFEEDADFSDTESESSDTGKIKKPEIKIGGVLSDDEVEEGEIYEEKEEDQNDVDEVDVDADEDEDVDADEADLDLDSENEEKEQILKKPAPKMIISNDEDDDDDDYAEDEGYLQKFDKEINNAYIQAIHPECKIHNYDEISCLTKIIRDADGIIVDPLHRTIPILTKYERARVIGQRSKQINSGSKPFVKVPENIIDGHLIAEIELEQKRIPFIIRRPFPSGGSEYWNLRDLELI